MTEPIPSPITDAFGTRLDPSELLHGLAELGVRDARLIVADDGLVLECDDPDQRSDVTARALTWLRSRFSPLVPLRSRGRTYDDAGIVDERQRRTEIVTLVELTRPPLESLPLLENLLDRLGPGTGGGVGNTMVRPEVDDPAHAQLSEELAQALDRELPARGWSPAQATLTWVLPAGTGMTVATSAGQEDLEHDGPHFLAWSRPGGDTGIRPAVLVAASRALAALRWLARALCDLQAELSPGEEILFDGLAWKAARRPTVAVPPDGSRKRIHIDPERCTRCGVCAQMCPEGYLSPEGQPVGDDPTACARCYDCVDACPADAIRPTQAPDTATLASSLRHRPGWLSRLAGLPGPSFPAPFPPSYLLPKKDPGPPRYVLGLAVMTMQEHAAVLLRDGEIVGAIEHERLVRVRHAGWHPVGRPGVTAAVDPTTAIEETFCRRPIRALLEQAGITLDDIDIIAVNGLHGRYAGAISFVDGAAQLPTIRTGRVVYLPHHLCHAASVYRLGPPGDAWVLTVDGRGDRECAAVWRATDGRLRAVETVLSLTDRSIGGVYEGITRLLGFGTHGQGSVMALAAFGRPNIDLREHLSMRDDGTLCVHESGIDERFAHLARQPHEPLRQEHKDLAASLQQALESVALALLRRNSGNYDVDTLLLAGGVALNCRMNEHLRRWLRPRRMFVQPGANDAGTALGAALQAWADAGGAPAPPMEHAGLGPAFDDTAIEQAVRRSGLRYRRSDSIAADTAARLAAGEIVCWFQGPMEFGPRALGARSILADPRRPVTHALVNAIKQREPWRPFGPSILAGHERQWIEDAFDTRFMLFTMPLVEERRAQVPAVVHFDGSTRPQVVHAETQPLYHALISEFHRLTGVPLVLNTSFNRRGEPIVCTPQDALESFTALGADVLAMGNFLIEREPAEPAVPPPAEELAALPGGRRLSLRLTTRCDLDCGHCTLRDQHGRPDRSFESARNALVAGRYAGCDELVLLRGEPTLRADLAEIVRAARAMGYRFVQIQTNAKTLASPDLRGLLLDAGVDSFEVQLLAASEALHDELSGVPGSLPPIVQGIRGLLQSGRQVLVTIPVLAGNLAHLTSIVTLAGELGARRIQFNFPRPVEMPDRIITTQVPRLAAAAAAVREASAYAQRHGMRVSTEALPFCHLPPELHATPDATEEWRRHRIDDLHLVHESAADARGTQRPEAPPCRECILRTSCPKTWALYLELFGSSELRAITPP